MSEKKVLVDLDFSELESFFDGDGSILTRIKLATQLLSGMAHAHIVEQAQSKLRTRRELFLDNLHPPKWENEAWVITLDGKAAWIDDGLPHYSMLDTHLNGPKVKISKKGVRYLVIPFKHNKRPAQRSAPDEVMVNALKTELKKRSIPWGKIETNVNGKPLLGKLHSINLSTPVRPHETMATEGGMVPLGPMGRPFSAHPRFSGQTGPSGRPFLWGLHIYQKEIPTSRGTKVSRQMVTFRTMSEEQRGGGKWEFPGVEGSQIFEETSEWATRLYETVIKPDIIKAILGV